MKNLNRMEPITSSMMPVFNVVKKTPLALVVAMLMAVIPETCWPANPEARAVWVTRWEYTSGGLYPSTHRANIRRLMERAAEGHCNVIVLQVRGQGDAFYQSNYEPWAWELTGYSPSSLGTDPGWDPLQYAIEQAHQRGLELHAWLNTFTCWRGDIPPPTGIVPEHIYNTHPEWICADKNGVPQSLDANDYVSVSPGIPAVREHVHNVAMDVLERYDVDGIHFDYIRYPHAQYSRDAISDSLFFEQFGFSPDDDEEIWKDWQRDQVTEFVNDFYYAAAAVKPMVKISAAVIGRYNNPNSGWDAYNIVYQDARRWASRGIIDYLAPMIYWAMYEFAPLIDDWTHYSYGRQVYAGIAAYKMDEFGGWSAIEAQIDTARAFNADGLLFFRSGSLDQSDGYYWSQLGSGRFYTRATVPPMWWKDNVPPNGPVNITISPLPDDQVAIAWEIPPPASDGDLPAYYGIYRAAGATVDVDDPEQLIHITVGPTTVFYDTTGDSGVSYTYGVVAYDDGDNESGLASTVVTLTGEPNLPGGFLLRQNYPNPFNANTSIEFLIPEGPLPVTLTIYNIMGQEVLTLLDKPLSAGRHRLNWDGTDAGGHQVSSGIYFYALRAENFQQTKRMILLR